MRITGSLDLPAVNLYISIIIVLPPESFVRVLMFFRGDPMNIAGSFWPWYVCGPLIGLYVPVIYLLVNRHFGVSSTFRDICAATLHSDRPYFHYDWKQNRWRLLFVAGIAIGGFLGQSSLKIPASSEISAATLQTLSTLGVKDYSSLVPTDLFSWGSLLTMRGILFAVVGGFLVGFGTRYAEGCTSGHSIHGIANFQRASIIATTCFFIGGLVSTYLLIPFILHP